MKTNSLLTIAAIFMAVFILSSCGIIMKAKSQHVSTHISKNVNLQ